MTYEETLEFRRKRQLTPEEAERAKQWRQHHDAEQLRKWEKYESDSDLMSEYLAKRNAQCHQANTEKQARQAERERDKQKARADLAERGQTPRGVPFSDTTLAQKPEGHEYTPEDFCEALKWDQSRAGAVRCALRSWNKGTKHRSRWALTRAEAEAFWLWYGRARHEKQHPPRRENKIAHK
jgi:hypothetical protein